MVAERAVAEAAAAERVAAEQVGAHEVAAERAAAAARDAEEAIAKKAAVAQALAQATATEKAALQVAAARRAAEEEAAAEEAAAAAVAAAALETAKLAKMEAEAARLEAEAARLEAVRLETKAANKPFVAFISHFKAEAAMEARHIHEKLEHVLGRRRFLDSDDLSSLSVLKQNVLEADVVVIVQSKAEFERPWCLIELVTAIDYCIPIVGVRLTSGGYAYDHSAASAFLESLDTELDKRNPGASGLLRDNGIDLIDAAWKLSSTLPAIISIAFDPSASKNVLTTTIRDIAEDISKAKPPIVPPKDSFLQKSLSSAAPHGSARHHVPNRVSASSPATVPLAVPPLPTHLEKRQSILQPILDYLLPQSDDSSNRVLAMVDAMGGIGKTTITAAAVHDDGVRAAYEHICWFSLGQTPDLLQALRALYAQLTGQPLDQTISDIEPASKALHKAADASKCLLVLDGVWDAKHVSPLNFVDAQASSQVIVARSKTLIT